MSRITLSIMAVWLGILPGAQAQGTAGLSGQLLDRATRLPLAGAAVSVLGARIALRADSAGQFGQTDLTPGTYVVQVRALGYESRSHVITLVAGQTLTIVVELDPLPITLPGVTVEGERWEQRGLPGFEERRAKGRGVYITERDIQDAQATRLGDVLRTTAGVRQICRGNTCVVRMSRSPRNCAPNFFLDGFPANNATTLEMSSVGIIAIEIYRTISETPLEFLRGPTYACGTIVIWTRSGL
jgi:hypothetical protein